MANERTVRRASTYQMRRFSIFRAAIASALTLFACSACSAFDVRDEELLGGAEEPGRGDGQPAFGDRLSSDREPSSDSGLTGDGDFEPCAAQDVTLEPILRTAHSITWSWDPSEIRGAVDGYFMWVGEESAAVAEQREPAFSWSSFEDPNLAWYYSSYGPNRVDRTTTRGLDPGTEYFVDLYVSHPTGCSFCIASASASTLPQPSGRIPIFDEEVPSGADLFCLRESSAFDDSSNSVLDGNPEATGCFPDPDGNWINLRMRDLAIDLSTIPAQSWADAFIELSVVAPRPVYYLEVLVQNLAGDRFWYFNPHYATISRGRVWQHLEVPLNAMLHEGAPPTQQTLTAIGYFQVGANWGDREPIQLDSVAVRY